MIPLAKFCMVVGEEGIGKGTILAHLAARLTRGELDGDLHGQPCTVLFLADEDGFGDTIGRACWRPVRISTLSATSSR